MPLAVGTKVYYMTNPLTSPGPHLAEGKVRHYIRPNSNDRNPGYTIDVTNGDFGTVQVVPLNRVAKKDKKGKSAVLLMIAEYYRNAAAHHKKVSEDCIEQAARLEIEAGG